MTPDTQLRLDDAVGHLAAAAAHARRDGSERGQHLAALIDLTAAGIAPPGLLLAHQTPESGGVEDSLRAALAVLDTIDPLDGPPDLLAWSWDLADLLRYLGSEKPAQP